MKNRDGTNVGRTETVIFWIWVAVYVFAIGSIFAAIAIAGINNG